MKITFLGTAGSTIAKKSTYPAILINNDLLLDCGEGTTQKLLQINQINAIKTICLTHLHNDHFLGLFSLLWYYWINGRKDDLNLIGPVGTQTSVITILKLINTPVSMMKSFHIRYNELEDTNKIEMIDNANYNINYVNVDHRISAFAYRIESEDKKICYSGDTRPIPSLEQIADNCNLLICESTFPDEMADFAHKHFHCTPSDAAKIAIKANCKKLILIHIPLQFRNQLEIFKLQAKKLFNKEVIIAEDLLEIVI